MPGRTIPIRSMNRRSVRRWSALGEQSQSHVILANIPNDVEIRLRRQMAQFPGLEMRQSTHRKYDDEAAIVACHILGRLTPVDEVDRRDTANMEAEPLRKYLPRDLKGRAGLEGLAEPLLRGTRGQIVHALGKKDPVPVVQPINGRDVRTSIDLGLQAQILESFKTVVTHNNNTGADETLHELHGAAVVIDIDSSEVLAMASYPTYDLNKYDADYAKNESDEFNQPLVNRATMGQHEPGSTVKPEVGSVAVTEGVIRYDEGIPCTGYMIYHDDYTNRNVRLAGTNRCWVASMFSTSVANVSGHQIPDRDPHRGIYGNVDGSLVLQDAIQRSCNVYFQTVADRMHLVGVVAALKRFGLGEATGIGIPEASGHLPKPSGVVPRIGIETMMDRRTGWLAGIGQGQVTATPLQMANVAATLARRGIWRRPRLLTGDAATAIYDHKPGDSRDLNLAPLALDAVKTGMIRVTRTLAGGATALNFASLVVAGKTGSAQAGQFSIRLRDAQGKILREPGIDGKPDEKGAPLRQYYAPGSPEALKDIHWYYTGVSNNPKHLAHAWFIAYAPADKPKIALCVFVEYGGSGGQVAGAVARDVIEACVQHQYLPLTGR